MTAAAEHPTPVSPTGFDSTQPGPPVPRAGQSLDDPLRLAALIAVEALEERARASRLLLTDRTLHGLADPAAVRHSLERDLEAVHVLRAALRASGT